MNKCIIQLWEESERGWGVRPDGCSLHLNKEVRDFYIDGMYLNRSNLSVPNEYDRPIGIPISCLISDGLFENLSQIGTIRLFEMEKNNLIKMGEIVY